MNDSVSPTRAYDLLEQLEREIVDDYVQFVKSNQKFKGERIAVALGYAIPPEFVKRSKGVLNKPLVRCAVGEKIQAEADEQDLSPVRVIKEHAAIAFSSIMDFIEPAQFGEFKLKEIVDMPEEKMGAVKTIRTIPTPYGNRMEVILHDKLPSLKALGEMTGLVASDKAPVLEEYSKPASEKKQLEAVPEKAYSELLENSAHA